MTSGTAARTSRPRTRAAPYRALGLACNVARRLLGEPVALVVAAREPGVEFRGLPDLLVGGLGEADARDLLGTVISRPLDEQVRERFIAETRGNPLALLELPRGLTQANLDGGFDVMAAPGRLEYADVGSVVQGSFGFHQ